MKKKTIKTSTASVEQERTADKVVTRLRGGFYPTYPNETVFERRSAVSEGVLVISVESIRWASLFPDMGGGFDSSDWEITVIRKKQKK